MGKIVKSIGRTAVVVAVVGLLIWGVSALALRRPGESAAKTIAEAPKRAADKTKELVLPEPRTAALDEARHNLDTEIKDIRAQLAAEIADIDDEIREVVRDVVAKEARTEMRRPMLIRVEVEDKRAALGVAKSGTPPPGAY